MNPLEWKREHQIAFVCAIGLGCLVGILVGFAETETYTSFRWGTLWCERQYSCVYLLNGYWLKIILWTALGGLIGAALVYIRQLLRS